MRLYFMKTQPNIPRAYCLTSVTIVFMLVDENCVKTEIIKIFSPTFQSEA